MNLFVVGSGGREHALVWKLSQSGTVSRILCAPGNPGIGSIAELVPLKASDMAGLADFAEREHVDLTVIGPEQPLADGIVDLFEHRGLRAFGPSKSAAELEWSKAFAKEFMQRNGIPTAAHRIFRRSEAGEARQYLAECSLPVVLKADGLAAGKGVLVCPTVGDAEAGLRSLFEARTFGASGDTVVIEEYLEGEEASVFALSDGQHFVTLAPAQDHKRIFDGDRGKNTGGMGAYAPTPFVPPETLSEVERTIVGPTLRGMAMEGRTYRGCLYVGLMLTARGPKVVEYNCRFGDPETQVVLPLFEGDLADLLMACAHEGGLSDPSRVQQPTRPVGHAVCVVIASQGYPDAYPTGMEISGLDALSDLPGVMVFHAGTARAGDRLVTSGGRVLGVTAFSRGGSLRETVRASYDAVRRIHFEGAYHRTDIGKKGLVN